MSEQRDPSRRVEIEIFTRQLLGGPSSSSVARQTAAAVREVFIPKGTVIYREGDPSNDFYFVASGRVRLVAEGVDDWEFGTGGVFGVFDGVLDRPRSRTATAVADLVAFELRMDDWYEILEDNLDGSLALFMRSGEETLALGLALAPTGGLPQVAETAAAATQQSLNFFERLLFLRRAPVFRMASTEALLQLARRAKTRFLPAGTVLQKEGSKVERLQLVVQGLVDVQRRSPAIEGIFGPDMLVGGYAGLGVERWAYTSSAHTDVLLLELGLETTYELMEDHFDLHRSLTAFSVSERARLQELMAPQVGASRSSRAPSRRPPRPLRT